MKNYMVCFAQLNDKGELYTKTDSVYDTILWPTAIGSVVTSPKIRGLAPGQQGGSYVDSEKSDMWVVVSYQKDDCIPSSYGRLPYTEVCSCAVEYISYRNSPTNVTSWLQAQGVTEPLYRGSIVQKKGYACVGDKGTVTIDKGVAVAGDEGNACSMWGVAEVGKNGVAVSKLGVAIGEEGAKVYADHGVAIGQEGSHCYTREYGLSQTKDRGKSITKYGGIAISACHGSVQAGRNGLLIVRLANDNYQVARVGERGIKPDVLYEADSWGFYDPERKQHHLLRMLRHYWNKLVSFFLI